MKTILKYTLAVFALAAMPDALLAQASATASAPAVAKASPYQDPVFYLLCTVAVLLLAFIFQLQKVLLAVAKKSPKSKASVLVQAIVLLVAFSVLPDAAFAADKAEQVPFLHHGFGTNAINALVVIITFELCVILYYTRMIRLFTQNQVEEKPYVEVERLRPSFWERFNRSVAIEQEAAILTDHNYDGIRELDNNLPPWWKYGFYLTIVWALAYLVHYHVAHSGPGSLDEYNNQLAVAQAELIEYRKKTANLVDETNVKLLVDAAEIAKGKEIFDKNCTTCHGAQAQGAQVGPNLTDDYWLYGGGIQDVFKTIKYGVQGKGMKSWKSDLTPSMIAQVSSYIKSLHGTMPPNPKAPDGTIWTEPLASPVDSVPPTPKAPVDSLHKPQGMAQLK